MRGLAITSSVSMMAYRNGRRVFAPLQKVASTGCSGDLPRLKGVVFDVDGTLWQIPAGSFLYQCQQYPSEPQNYMFGEMRATLGITKSTDILDHVYSLPTPEAREKAMEAVRTIELSAMAHQRPQPGLVALMQYLDAQDVPKAICSRNFDAPVHHLLSRFLPTVKPFHPVVTREFRPPKPDPAGLLHIARSWGFVAARSTSAGVDDEEQIRGDGQGRSHGDFPANLGTDEGRGDASGLIMVGDSIDDMLAGRRAGAATVLLANPHNEHLAEHECTDLVVKRLDELIVVLGEGFEGRKVSQ